MFRTYAPDQEVSPESIFRRLRSWREVAEFEITHVDTYEIELEFFRLPSDLNIFVEDVYQFCPSVLNEYIISDPFKSLSDLKLKDLEVYLKRSKILRLCWG